MLIAAIIAMLLIFSLFLQTIASGPRALAESQSDTPPRSKASQRRNVTIA